MLPSANIILIPLGCALPQLSYALLALHLALWSSQRTELYRRCDRLSTLVVAVISSSDLIVEFIGVNNYSFLVGHVRLQRISNLAETDLADERIAVEPPRADRKCVGWRMDSLYVQAV